MKRNLTIPKISIMAALLITMLIGAACNPLGTGVQTQAPLPTQPIPDTGPTPDASGPSVVVKDQSFAGNTVVVEQVVSEGPGWIAIHVQNEGRVGDAIAYAPVKDGVNRNVIVELDVSKATPVMTAMLHTDVGEVGKYEFPGPDVPVLVAGNMLNPAFTVSAADPGSAGAEAPKIVVSDQEVRDAKVVVEEIVVPGPAWVDIHMQTPDGKRGKDIGFAQLQEGVNRNVVVTVDPARVTPVLYVVLHHDLGEVGVYELPPGPDVNMEQGGKVVEMTFSTQPGVAVTGPTGQATEAAPAQEPSATTAAGPTATTEVMQHTDPTQAPPAAEPTQPPAPEPTQPPAERKPSITVVDQPLKDGTVVIPEVFSIGESWLVIHKQNPDGSMGTFIGFARVQDGVSTNVVVPVNTNLVTPVLHAMLHEDNDPVGELQFPGSDAPVLVDGAPLTPAFKILGTGSQDVVINVSSDPGTVRHLVDGLGRSVYVFLEDTPGVSNCTGDCQANWKPLLATGRLVPGAGVERTKLGIIILPDGSRHVTYAGLPLYTHTGDVNPGDINGQGLDGLWFLVNP